MLVRPGSPSGRHLASGGDQDQPPTWMAITAFPDSNHVKMSAFETAPWCPGLVTHPLQHSWNS